MKTVAVMQPYFLPYAGYFRLFAAADAVALLDCAQFPRRGWVHRNRLPNAAGDPAWLTLPLQHAPVTTAIRDLRFANDAAGKLLASARRFPVLKSCNDPLYDRVIRPSGSVCDYIEGLLEACCTRLGLPFQITRTSDMDIDPSLRGQERIIAAAQALGASRYINLEGGRTLYDPSDFENQGMELQILPNWEGPHWSILYRLLTEPAEDIALEIRGQI